MGENDRGDWSWPDLNQALPTYLGYGERSFPATDWDAVVARLGLERAHAVELIMLAVLGELREQSPDWQTMSLYQGSDWAVRQIAKAYPGLDDAARKALVWLFSYENK